ncbi:MAG: GTPase, partial [Oscillospiraceae bacterium]|nr:GTPase [Oscillospiraceae bacterium]
LTIAGKTIVSNLLKFIPGVGTAVGGMISGGTAGALTGALGRTYMVIMEKMLKGEITEKELENKETYRQFTDMFKENLKHSDNKSLLKM